MDTDRLPIILKSYEAMHIAMIGEAKFYKLVKSGELPAFKIGNQWRVYKTDLIAWINGGKNVRHLKGKPAKQVTRGIPA